MESFTQNKQNKYLINLYILGTVAMHQWKVNTQLNFDLE